MTNELSEAFGSFMCIAYCSINVKNTDDISKKKWKYICNEHIDYLTCLH